MPATIVFAVDKTSDANILRSLLKQCVPELDMSFYAAQGKLGLASLARNLAVDLRCAVMIIGDTGTPDPDSAETFKTLHRALMKHLLPKELVGVFAFSPSLEQVISAALGIDFENSTTQDRPSVIEAALFQSHEIELTAHPQIAQFIQAVVKLRTVLMLPAVAPVLHQPYEHAMK